jgi:predicted component of type VI protein secretion system
VRGRLAVVLSSARRRARAKGWEFELDMDWVLARYAEQSGCCLLTGLPLEFLPPRDGKHLAPQPFTPSIDRIDWRRGYTRDNSRLVCTAVNLALGAWGERALERLARAYLARRRAARASGRERVA